MSPDYVNYDNLDGEDDIDLCIKNFNGNGNSLINKLKKEFVTENSKDINDSDILYTLGQIQRAVNIKKIDELIYDINKAIGIEMGIFEFSLVFSTLNNIEKQLIPAIYKDRLEDILLNLDINSYLNNKTFIEALTQNILTPKLVAFMSPDQLHPASWAPIVNKIKFRQQTENTITTSDAYWCRKCGERKCKVNELQMRGADESTSLVITCLVCYNTFIK